MKYNRLTKEQFEEMHQEFINFLATQSITAEEWKDITVNKPEVAEKELDLFSDLIWEGVLNKVEYLEHFSPNQMFMFHITAATINLIAVKVDSQEIDITSKTGYNWLRSNLMDDSVTIYTSTKAMSDDRNKDIFALIRQGANITKGDLYRYFEEVVQE
ncbi:DUF6495 family protein [Zunongwangia sp. F260]|uniref:DUF6495 family protein n=1 Tax=Autumnicola lenta TaxID=3075593 RepID=A0ABU3CMH2_9FLAO|nr:DUF6495 family protein [Zunongwangia sp. F260]MDT0647550.1 DUF6495 family protein [Zunongwangia sp. F260]